MASTTIKITSYSSLVIDYTIANVPSNVNTLTRITFTKWTFKNSRSTGTSGKGDVYINFNPLSSYVDHSSNSFYNTIDVTIGQGVKTKSGSISDHWIDVKKQHSSIAFNIQIFGGYYASGEPDFSYDYDVTRAFTIPAKTSYRVSLNANGGTLGTTYLTKWYGETLSLTSGFTAPTRSGYKFIGWATSAANANAGTTASSYTANSATTLYAAWKPIISNIGLNISTVRVAGSGSTSESDDGEWCYGVIDYAIVGAAAGYTTTTITAPSGVVFDGHDAESDNRLTVVKNKAAGVDVYDQFSFYASNCDVDEKYTFTANMTISNTDYPSGQSALSLTKSDVLSAAYFPLDVLGDRSIDQGQRPGHGIAFGAPCVKEGFHIGMEVFIKQWAGVIQMFAGSTPPAGWLLCNGQAVSRTTYAELFAAIGTTWGAGNGSTTFNVPDLRGRTPIGAGQGSGLTARTLGGKVGSETHTLNADQIPAHTHGSKTLTGGFRARHYGTSGDGAQLVFTPSGIVDVDTKTGTLGKVNVGGVGNNGGYEQVTVNATHTHDSVGGGKAHNNMQPSAVVNFIIHTGKMQL